MSKKTDCMAFEKLFFSKTYDFLEIYLPKQACRSRHTIKQYKTGLSCFYDYVSDVRMLSPLSFTFIHFFHLWSRTISTPPNKSTSFFWHKTFN